MTNYSKGTDVEREWKGILEEKGHLVTRVAGSGNLSSEQPYDLHSTDASGRSYLWEVKSTGANIRYFTPSEIYRIERMKELAESHKMKSFVVVKFKGTFPGRPMKGKKFIVVSPDFVIRNKKVVREKQ